MVAAWLGIKSFTQHFLCMCNTGELTRTGFVKQAKKMEKLIIARYFDNGKLLKIYCIALHYVKDIIMSITVSLFVFICTVGT